MQSKKFYSKVSGSPLIIFILIALILVMITALDIYVYGLKPSKIFIHVVDLSVVGLIIWILTGTYYTIDDEFVHYRNGPFKGRIVLNSLSHIDPAVNKWNILQPGIATRGIGLHTKSGVFFFFAPKEEEAFKNAIKSANKKVKIN